MARLLDTPFSGFQTEARDPQAGLVIVHGMAEYADRYREIAQTLASRGIAFFAYELRGPGDDPGVRTHVDRFDRYVDDLGVVGAAVARRLPRVPVYAWGHSMGSIIATLAALRPDPGFAGVMTSSASLEVFRRVRNPLSLRNRFAAA